MYTRSTRFPELFLPGSAPIWWAFIPNPEGGRALRESTGHRDEKAAHAWYLDRVRQNPRGDASAGKVSQTLSAALASRIEWLTIARANADPTRKRLAAATLSFYAAHSKPLVRILGASLRLSDITHAAIRRYIVERSKEVRATTIRSDLVTLSCALRMARKDGIDAPHFADIVPDDFAAIYVPRQRWLTEEEVDAVLALLPPGRAAVVAFIVATGATYPSEVSPVRKAHVKGYDVHLHGTKRVTRNRKLRVPSHAHRYLDIAVKQIGPWGFEPWGSIGKDLKKAAAMLSRCPEHRETNRGGAGQHVKNRKPEEPCPACKDWPAFPEFCPVDLRRTFAQWLVRSGVPYELVYPMMGHSSPGMLERVYGKRDAAAVGDLVELALKAAPKGARRAG